jgi:hypothetical protein
MSMDFNQIPGWVCWLAQDADGSWWGYEVEPNQSHISWYENEVGQSIWLGKTAANRNWLHTLKRIRK